MTVSYEDVAAAHERIKTHARRTAVMTSGTVDALTGASVFFKCENLQRMGAFKFRGAFNALSQLSADEKRRGVLAFSSGNHAQAVALSGKLLGIRTTIVMPADAPKVKLEATRAYGAEVVTYQKHENREQVAAKLAEETCPSFRPLIIPTLLPAKGPRRRSFSRKPARSMRCSCRAEAGAFYRAALSPRAGLHRNAG
jgi:threonine dehydratase